MTDTAVRTTFTQTINGKPADNDHFFDVLNPATEEVAGQAPECTDEQVDEAMAAAVAAHKSGWLRDKAAVRTALTRASEVLTEHAEEVAEVLVAEQGKPFQAAYGEVLGSAYFIKYFADFEPTPHELGDGKTTRGRVTTQPVGPTLGITAWNIPLLLATAKLAPSIATGSPVIIKPSPYTPLSTLRMGELFRDVFPPGVLQILTGTDTLGPKLTSRKEIRKITMTGSTATGGKIYEAGAKDFKRVTLELGGNDAAVLLDDYDVSAMSERLFTAAFDNTGQLCICTKRIYVPAGRVDEVAEGLAAEAAKVTVGPGTEEGVTMGPLQNKAQYDKVTELIEDAIAKGASIVTGGNHFDGPGYFMEPTILKGCTAGMRVVDEEQFGPVMPLIAYTDLDATIEEANDTDFGLGGSVWGADIEQAEEISSRIHAGMVWVNSHGVGQYPAQPFAGVKSSGLGAELGQWGYAAASDLRVEYTTLGSEQA